MKVKVVGVKSIQGTSKKNGKTFDSYIVHYVRDGNSQGVTGEIADSMFIDKRLCAGRVPAVGDYMDVSRDNGYVEEVEWLN